MTPREPFGDVELMLEEYLSSPARYVVTHTPPDLKPQLAARYVVRVVRLGGGETLGGTTDRPRVQVLVHALATAEKPRDAFEEAARVRAELLSLPAVTSHGLLDRAETESGPTTVPHPDPHVVRVQMIFRVSTRR
jgi:hypothetical protein